MNRKNIVIIILILVVIASVGLYLLSKGGAPENQSVEDGLTGIEYKEATDEEKTESDENKNKITERINQENNQDDDSMSIVKPVISAYGQNTVTGKVEVGSYVPGVFEEGGVCTTTLQKSTVFKEKTTSGIENVSSVSCGFVTFEQGELATGTWSATVSYSSDTASGTSDPVQIEVN